jgi:hypothetical protein
MSSLVNKVKKTLHIHSKDDDLGPSTYNESQTATTGTTTGQPTSKQTATGGTAATADRNNGSVAVEHGPGSTAKGNTVVVEERDPNWKKARELTHGAEEASKISAAKAYEAEATLQGISDAHRAAQEAANRQAELAAQADAERRNIGTADYLHHELDKAKKVVEDHEKHHIEFNKNLEKTRDLVAEKESELKGVLPEATKHQRDLEGLSNKLNSIQGVKGDLEAKHAQHAGVLNNLQANHAQYANHIANLENQVRQLNLNADDLERQAKAARAQAKQQEDELANAKRALSGIVREADSAQKGIKATERDLASYREKEADLANRIKDAQLKAKQAADLAAAREAELQLARQQLEAEKAKGLPVEQDIERHRKQVSEKEREYTEAVESSKAAKAAYEHFAREAEKAGQEARNAAQHKETNLGVYEQLKSEAQAANAREAELWNEAKKYGNTGDANALQRLAEAEKVLGETGAVATAPIVTPQVGPKAPTTEGPKVHRSERTSEKNDDDKYEDVRTKH